MEIGVFHLPASRAVVLDRGEFIYGDLSFSSGGASRFRGEQVAPNAASLGDSDYRKRLFPETSRRKSSVHAVCRFRIRDTHNAAHVDRNDRAAPYVSVWVWLAHRYRDWRAAPLCAGFATSERVLRNRRSWSSWSSRRV